MTNVRLRIVAGIIVVVFVVVVVVVVVVFFNFCLENGVGGVDGGGGRRGEMRAARRCGGAYSGAFIVAVIQISAIARFVMRIKSTPSPVVACRCVIFVCDGVPILT